MQETNPSVASANSTGVRACYRRYVFAIAVILIVFSWPLFQLVRFSLQEDLYSYILLIPAVSAYFAWTRRDRLPRPQFGATAIARVTISIGIILAIAYLAVRSAALDWSTTDQLALSTAALVAIVGGVTALFLGIAVSRTLLFPLGFLALMIPLPDFLNHALETALQHGSAVTAEWMLRGVGTPVWRDDLIFRVPGIAIQVAPECSGIRSTLVLMITSLVLGQVFLRSKWRRTVLVLIAVPLGVLRNGFRVFTIAELCVHVGPQMIDSPIHHKGGPIFFLLSLIPFSFVLIWLAKAEERATAAHESVVPNT